jgi:hypothetical protein
MEVYFHNCSARDLFGRKDLEGWHAAAAKAIVAKRNLTPSL